MPPTLHQVSEVIDELPAREVIATEPLSLEEPSTLELLPPTGPQVTGRLVDAESGSALAGARVQVWSSPDPAVVVELRAEVRTGAQGHFSMPWIDEPDGEPWRRVLVARARHYAPGFQSLREAGDLGDWKLDQGELASGRVVDAQDQGVEGLAVSGLAATRPLLIEDWPALNSPFPWGIRLAQELAQPEEVTGPDGAFHLAWADDSISTDLHLVVTARGATPDGPTWAGVFERPLPPELILNWPEPAPLAGRVVGPMGPVDRARVVLLRRHGDQLLDLDEFVTTDAEGRFRLRSLKTPGRVLGVLARGMTVRLVEVDPATGPLVITLEVSRKAHINVVHEDGSVAAESALRLREPYVSSTSREPRVGPDGDTARDLHQGDPAWVDRLAPGRFVVLLGKEGPWIAEVSCPGYANQRVTNLAVSEQTVVLGRGDTLRGVVRRQGTGGPLAGAEVWLGPFSEYTKRYGLEVKRLITAEPTGADGRFELAGVPAGNYSLMASSPDSLDALQRLELTGEGLVIEHDIELSLPGVLTGTIVGSDPTLSPPFGVRCLPQDEQDEQGDSAVLSRSHRTDEAGGFRLEELSGGPHQLEVYTLSPLEKDQQPGPTGMYYLASRSEAAATREVNIIGGTSTDIVVELETDTRATCRVMGHMTGRLDGFRYLATWRPSKATASTSRQSSRTAEVSPDGSFDLGWLPVGSGSLRGEAVQILSQRALVRKDLTLSAGEVRQETIELPFHTRIVLRLIDRQTGAALTEGHVHSVALEGHSTWFVRVIGPEAELIVEGAGHKLTAQVDGYWFQSQDVDASSLGGHPVVFELEPCPAWEPRVVDEDGEPIAGARLLMLSERGGARLMLGASLQTDAHGRARIPGIAPGTYRAFWHIDGEMCSSEIDARDREAAEIVVNRVSP